MKVTDVQEFAVFAGGFVIVGGTLLAVFASAFASFQRDQVSKVLPKRYWVVGSDASWVRFGGIAAVILGLVLVGVAFFTPWLE